MRPHRPAPMGGFGKLGNQEYRGMPASSNFGLWRPGGAFFAEPFCVMSYHHTEGLCTFLFEFWRENSKLSSCQQLVTQKDSLSHRFV